MRSIKEILKERLPEYIYEKAVSNRINDVIIEEEVDALCSAFCWDGTLEGFKYWEGISRMYFDDNDPVVNYHVVDPPNENKTEAYPFFTSVSTKDSLSTLDQFAMAAMQGIIGYSDERGTASSIAERAYYVAEAMLAEKLKRENVKNENKS